MNKTIVLVVFMVLIGFCIWVTNNRFYVTSSARGIAYEVDRKTGESWYLVGDEKTLQTDLAKEALIAKSLVEKLPNEEVVKVTGNAGFNNGYFSGKIYNGSNWKITRIIFTVSAVDKTMDDHLLEFLQTHKKKPYLPIVYWTRDLSTSVSIDPLTTENFSQAITGDDYTKCDWSIKEVYGIKVPDDPTDVALNQQATPLATTVTLPVPPAP